jgi:hypothetical protein
MIADQRGNKLPERRRDWSVLRAAVVPQRQADRLINLFSVATHENKFVAAMAAAGC